MLVLLVTVVLGVVAVVIQLVAVIQLALQHAVITLIQIPCLRYQADGNSVS